MKRIRMPAMSATIGAMAMPMNICALRGLLLALGRVLEVAASLLDRFPCLADRPIGLAAGFLHRPALAVVAAAAAEHEGEDDGERYGSHRHNCPRPACRAV